jgi:hypothetical protein
VALVPAEHSEAALGEIRKRYFAAYPPEDVESWLFVALPSAGARVMRD